MFEKQRRMENDKSKASASTANDYSAASPTSNRGSDAANVDVVETGQTAAPALASQEENPSSSSRKQKAPQDDPNHTNTKRARTTEA